MNVSYLHLPAGQSPPPIEGETPYKAVVVLRQTTPADWQSQVSDWLVATGCLYMMAWGADASSWDDSLDCANLARFDYADIPDDKFVMTTWHDDEPLSETFWFAGNAASHPALELSHVVIIDVSPIAREREMLAAYSEAQKQT